MELHYFDFEPPARWIGFRMGRQIRLIPPDTSPADARCAIVVSPLVPRTPGLPPAAALIEQALDAEARIVGTRVLERHGPSPARSDHGLAGVSYEVRAEGPSGVERRRYVMLVDDVCCYGLSYAAAEAAFEAHAATFDAAVRTIKPFAGRLVPPAPPPFEHFGE